MALDFNQLKETLESLNLSLGAGKVFFVCPGTDAWSSDLIGLQKVSGQVHGSLQAGLDACTSGRGDTVIVLPGTYTHASATLSMSKSNVTLMALNNQQDQTLINTGMLDDDVAVGFPTVTVTGAGCTIKGFSLANGWYVAGPAANQPTLNVQASYFTVENCLFTYDGGNEGLGKYGVYCDGAANNLSLKVIGCTFDNCVTGGAAIYFDCADASGGTYRNPHIVDCHFVGVNKNDDNNWCIAATADDDDNSIFGMLIKDCVFDPSGTGGGGGEDMLNLINAGDGDYEGVVVGCIFGCAYDAGSIGNVGGTLRFVKCYGQGGLSTGQPA